MKNRTQVSTIEDALEGTTIMSDFRKPLEVCPVSIGLLPDPNLSAVAMLQF